MLKEFGNVPEHNDSAKVREHERKTVLRESLYSVKVQALPQ